MTYIYMHIGANGVDTGGLQADKETKRGGKEEMQGNFNMLFACANVIADFSEPVSPLVPCPFSFVFSSPFQLV